MFTPLFVGVVIFMQKILKKEDPQYSKHNKKFDYDNYPDLSSPSGHTSETIIIKMKQLV
jgi:hypothetical protein